MEEIVALGCSLTAQSGYVKHLNRQYNLGIKNLAVSAGSNELQNFRLNNMLVTDQIGRDTILLWQITSPWRSFKSIPQRYSKSYENKLGNPNSDGSYDCFYEKIGLFDERSLILLCNHKYFDDFYQNPAYNLHMTICDIVKWSFLVKNVIVYLGWSFLDGSNSIDKSLELLSKYENIKVIPKQNSILDVCADNGWALYDDFHPTEESYIKWSNLILEPILFSMIDLKSA